MKKKKDKIEGMKNIDGKKKGKKKHKSGGEKEMEVSGRRR